MLILKNRAEILEKGDWALHAESITLARPVVIRLLTYVRIPRDAHRRKITRRAVFARDRWTCQYCGHERGNLTVDHVVPRSKGGPSTWDNIVTCCAPCNRRKGDRLPKQANMVPARKPKAPNPTIFIHVAAPTIPAAWEQYLWWRLERRAARTPIRRRRSRHAEDDRPATRRPPRPAPLAARAGVWAVAATAIARDRPGPGQQGRRRAARRRAAARPRAGPAAT